MKQTKCKHIGCRKTPKKYRKECDMHLKREYKKRHPLKYFYNALKQNAKRRCKDFQLTFQQYKQLVTDTGYFDHPGRFADRLTFDRIRNEEGYTIDNIQIITLSENCRKFTHDPEFSPVAEVCPY